MNFDLLIEGQSEMVMSVLDEDLSFIATQAALELDMLIEGRDPELLAVPRLSSIMKNSFRSVQAGGASSFLDPAMLTIMNRAFFDSNVAKLKTVDQLMQKSLEFASELESQVDPKQRNGELAVMKRFCLALASCSAAYRETFLEHRSKHPYRK